MTQGALEYIALLVTPLALFSGILYFVAWIRTRAFFTFFGVDTNLVGYGSHDYLVRGGSLAFRPAASMILAGVVAYAVMRAGQALVRRYPPARAPLSAGLGLPAVVLLGLGFAAAYGTVLQRHPFRGAVALIGGAILLEVAVICATTGRKGPVPVFLRRVLVAGMVTVGLFWACSIQAQHAGEVNAEDIAAALRRQPDVVLYSAADLSLDASGVTTEPLPRTAEYRYRYSGLRLLVFNDERWILLPENWRAGRAPAIVIPDSDKIRVELGR